MKTIEIKWNTDDVMDKAYHMEVTLSEIEADEILDNIYRTHDASIGVNWDVIEYHIEDFLSKQTY